MPLWRKEVFSRNGKRSSADLHLWRNQMKRSICHRQRGQNGCCHTQSDLEFCQCQRRRKMRGTDPVGGTPAGATETVALPVKPKANPGKRRRYAEQKGIRTQSRKFRQRMLGSHL